MKIAHVISSIDKTMGGPSRSSTQMAINLLQNENLTLDFYTLLSLNPLIKHFESDRGTIIFEKPNFASWSYSLHNNLQNKDYDLYHGHGIWHLPVHQMANSARKKKSPYLISPRGMLDSWSIRQNSLKKKIGLKLFQFSDLQNATCLHATALLEAKNIRDQGFTKPIAVVPNGVNINTFRIDNSKKENKILFLSRIHSQKGIELLLKSWFQIEKSLKSDWILEIVGDGEQEYINFLKDMIDNLGLKNQVFIKPPVYGLKKVKLYQEASLFVLPSYSENFGIVIAEALACGTPVITTTGTPWNHIVDRNCGWYIELGIKSLKEKLIEALNCGEKELVEMGKRGRDLIEEKFSIKKVSEQMFNVYKWIVEDEDKPSNIL